MGESITDFIAKVKGIEGVTIAERKRSLFQLFRSSHLDSQSQDFVISKLQPQTYFEKLFLVEFLIYYRRFKELFVEFLKGDDVIISKISHQRWFFQNALAEMGPEFVRQLFRTLSFSLKLKILKKMAPILEEKQADEIFHILLQQYGISMAANILTSCSEGKIEQALKYFSIQLWTNQLKLLHDKNPQLVILYLEEREKHVGNRKFMDFNPIFQYIARKNPDLYHELFKKYNFKLKLGKRVTKKLIAARRNEIIASPEIYIKNLNAAELVRELGPDFQAVFFKLFPRRIEDSPKAESSRLLKFYPRRGRYNLMITTYNQIFHKKLEECPYLIDDYVLQMIMDPDEREKLARIKTANNPHDCQQIYYQTEYLQYYRTDHCIEAIKEMIEFTRTPYERRQLVSILAKTCFINEDYDAFLRICQFVLQRFKNDLLEVQDNFINQLVNGGCNFNKLTEDHWQCVNEITARPYFSPHLLEQVCFHYIKFLHRVGKPLESEIVPFFGKNRFDPNNMGSLEENPEAVRNFLCTFIEVAPKISSTTENLDCQLMLACRKYNKSNPKNTINILDHPRLIQSVKSALTGKIIVENNALSSALELIVCTKPTSEEIEEIVELYWVKIADFGTSFAAKWLLRHRPDTVEKNFEKFLHFAISKEEINLDPKIWQCIKSYSHLHFDKRALEFCLSRLKEESYPEFLAKPLSLLMRPEDFLVLVESYKPKSFKIDLQNEEDGRRFRIQRNLLKETKNINQPVQVLSLILQFCFEDYISSCLSPLYSACYRAPEDQIETFIDELNSREYISVKKHALGLICTLFDEQKALTALKSCELQHSMAVTYKYFLKNQSRDCWLLFKSKFSSFDGNISSIKLLVNRPIPKTYKRQYFEIIWDFLIKTDYKKHKKILLLKAQYDTILGLELTLFASVIEDSFLIISEMNEIVSKYLIYGDDRSKFNAIFNYLEKFKTCERFSGKKLRDFIYAFFSLYMEWEGENHDLVTRFISKFQQIFPFTETPEETITLNLLKFKKQTIKEFSRSVIQLHNDLLLKYGETITGIVAEYLKKLLPHFCKDNLQIYQFYDKLVNNKQSIQDLLLVIKLLPTDSEPEDKESFRYYDCTLLKLQEIDLDNIQLHLNLHFKYRKLCLNFEYYEQVNTFCINMSSWLKPGARRKVGYMYY